MFDNKKIEICDIHMHFGSCNVFDVEVTEKTLIDTLQKYNITSAVVQLFPGINSYKENNDALIDMLKKYENKLYGLISINPHVDDTFFNSEAERLFDTGLFKAIKLHTIGHAINPLSNDAKKVYKFAADHDIPVMVHTGPGIPFALPSMIRPIAKEYSVVNFILAHAGDAQIYAPDAVLTAGDLSNVFLETSWTSIGDKNWFYNSLGAEKIIFGSDMPENIPVELTQYQLMNLNDEDLSKILSENTKRLLRI